MKVLKFNPQKPNKKIIRQAVTILKKGGVIIYPTDTCYGLGGIFNNQKVIEKILKIKKRKDKKFPLIADSLAQVKKFFKLSPGQEKLAKKYWPGPLSLVVSKNFAVRVSKNKITQILAQKVGKPLIATSANISGQKNCYSTREVLKQFRDRKYLPDLLLDAGPLKKIKPSTLVLIKKGKIQVLRKGAIRLKKFPTKKLRSSSYK